MLERDDNIPEWDEVQNEVLKIAEIRKQENEKSFIQDIRKIISI